MNLPTRSRMTFRLGLLAAGCLVVLLNPGSASAQGPVAVIPIQGLRFGTLTPGLLSPVSVLDNQGRAGIEVTGRGQVSVSFGLPAGLRTKEGGLLPVFFGASDGRVLIAGNGTVHNFDPRSPYNFVLSGSQGQASVFLGGTASPAITQRPGTYEGEITVTVVISNGNT
jgi:hypothetical protein